MTSPATQALKALFSGHNHTTWLSGTSALAHLGLIAEDSVPDIITDADEDTCAKLIELAREVVDAPVIFVEPLSGRTLEQCLYERGITADAIAVDTNGQLIDPHQGITDIKSEKIRTTRPPSQIFRAHPAQLLNVAKIMAHTGLTPSKEMSRFARRDSGNILDVTNRGKDWGQRINALLMGREIQHALRWLQSIRVIDFLMPEIAAMVGFHNTTKVHHKDIWDHTIQVTEKTAKNLVVRWAALCHDIGKVWTRSVNRDGKVHFFRHEEHGALLFESIAHRFALKDELTSRVAYLIRNHSRVNLYQTEWSDSAVRRLVRETEGHLDDLLLFSKADYTTKSTSRIREMQQTMHELETRIAEIIENDAKLPNLPKGLGKAIMNRFKLNPSPVIGELKQLLEIAVESGELPGQGDDEIYVSWLSESTRAIEQISEAGGCI